MDYKFKQIVTEFTDKAKLVAFDDCHKIYIAMDDGEAGWYVAQEWALFRGSSEQMAEKVWEWYRQANKNCGLQYVDATSTSKQSTDTEHFSDFHRVIPQGAEARWDWTIQEEYWEKKELV